MRIFNKLLTTSSVVAVAITLSSCARLGPQQAIKLPLPPVNTEAKRDDTEVVFKDLQNKALNTDKKEKSELVVGTDRFMPSEVNSHKKEFSTSTGSYNLNFDEADLGEMAKVVLGDILGQNYVLSPKVVGKVTLQTTKPLSKEELLPTLEMVLQMNNAALVKDGNIYHIEPSADALFSSDVVTSGSQKAGYQTKIIPVKNVPVQNIADILKPLVHEKTILHIDGARNILIASGTPDEMARVLDMISTFDIDILKGRSFGVFPLAHVEPETIITELEEVFNHKEGKTPSAGGGEGGAPAPSGTGGDFFRFIPIERMNAVLAITHQARYLHDIQSWIDRLDKTNTASGSGVNVYKVQHSDAEDLAGTLNEIFNGTPKQDKAAKLAPGQNSASLTNKSATGTNSAESKSSRRRSSAASRLGGGSSSGNTTKVGNVEEARIIADKGNNALIIVATPSEYETILPVIKQLDIMPLQVLIDATIVSVDLNDDLKYGISWYLHQHKNGISSSAEGATLGALGATAKAFATGGLSLMYNSGAINALLSAQADKGNVNIISSPSLMVLNNQEATIEVGDQIPTLASTLSTAVSASNSGVAQSSTIQYRDTGVKLEVTPRVNANGMVIMEVKQSVSEPKESAYGVTTSATISKKEINSSVAVLDGETIVLGGLIKESNTYGKAGIPFLQETPWLGALFGNTTDKRDKSELVVLITPRVVKSRQDATQISTEFKRKLTGIYEDKPVIKK
ncbi:MAG: type II secretion system secretin GspD [Methylococcaceae bacterium]